MPDLPSISVTAAQATRLLGVFTNAAGYQKWLKQALLDETLRREARRLHEIANTQVKAGLDSLASELPPPDVEAGK